MAQPHPRDPGSGSPSSATPLEPVAIPTNSPLAERFFPEWRFGGFSRIDGTIAFYQRVDALIRPEHVVLDVGCGRGSRYSGQQTFRGRLMSFRGRCRQVIGIDVSDEGKENPTLDEFRQIKEFRWPVGNDSVDVAFSDYVLEHIEDIDSFFGELNRVVRPGGVICLRTPNAWSYVAIASRLIPNRAHLKVLGTVQKHRDERDIFPTYYRCNTPPSARKMLAKHGFRGVVFTHESEPLYLTFHPFAYCIGLWIGKMAPRSLRTNLFIFAERPLRPE